jgi:hypothetical protein
MTATNATAIHATRPREMSYIGACLSCEDEKIREMLVRASQISYASARRAHRTLGTRCLGFVFRKRDRSVLAWPATEGKPGCQFLSQPVRCFSMCVCSA